MHFIEWLCLYSNNLSFVFIRVRVNCSNDWQNIHIYKNRSMIPVFRAKRQSYAKVQDSAFFMQRRKRDSHSVFPSDDDETEQDTTMLQSNPICNKLVLPMTVKQRDGHLYYSMNVRQASHHYRCFINNSEFCSLRCMWRQNKRKGCTIYISTHVPITSYTICLTSALMSTLRRTTVTISYRLVKCRCRHSTS